MEEWFEKINNGEKEEKKYKWKKYNNYRKNKNNKNIMTEFKIKKTNNMHYDVDAGKK